MSFDDSGSLPEGETRTNLIINYLPQQLTDQEFYKIFVIIGPIKNCRIMKDLKTGYSFGFGFVEYQKAEDAAKAILKLNNFPVQHKRIKVSYARPLGDDIKETNLYIQNIPKSYTVDQLEELFSSYGHIVQKNILKDKITGLPRGVGFVRFDKKVEAEAAISGMNGITPEGGTEPLLVKIAEDPGAKDTNLYIQNVPRSYTVEQLEDMFSPYGQIVQKTLLKDIVTGLPRGVGFVRYETKGEAEAAINGMHGITPDGGTEPLIVKLAEEHGKVKAAYNVGYRAALNNTRGGGQGRGRGNNFNRGGAGNFRGRGNYNNVNRQNQQGGKMAPDRVWNRYNPIGSGGGYSGGYGGGYGGGGNNAETFYQFSTPTFSRDDYTSFSNVEAGNYGHY